MASAVQVATEAWEALYRAQATVSGELIDNGVWGTLQPPEYGVLHALSTAPAGKRLSELNEDVLLSQPGLSRLLRRLEARGLVVRDADPDDGRAARMRLTPEGAELQHIVGSRHARHIREVMTRVLSTGQLELLRDLCLAITAEAVVETGCRSCGE